MLERTANSPSSPPPQRAPGRYALRLPRSVLQNPCGRLKRRVPPNCCAARNRRVPLRLPLLASIGYKRPRRDPPRAGCLRLTDLEKRSGGRPNPRAR